MTASLDSLIRDLGADLRPVRRLGPPLARTGAWLALVTAVGLPLAMQADLPGIAHRLATVPDLWLAAAGSTATAMLAAAAVFQLSLPDRSAAWALVPAPGVALWAAASGVGALRDWIAPDAGAATLGEARTYCAVMVALSVPLSVVMALMIRRACPLRPGLVSALGGLAVAAAAATLLTFVHVCDAGATDIAVQAGGVALVVGANRLVGGPLLDAAHRGGPRRLP